MEPHFQEWLAKLPRRYRKYRQPKRLWSMTIPRELCFCESYAQDCFSGKGRMVDLGCWYGATTFSLARGLIRNRRAKDNRIIEAFDRFIWNKRMDHFAKHIKMPPMYRDGESFYHDVQKLLEPYSDIVRLYQQDLMKYEPAQEPVELLFVDAMKSWPLAKKIVTDFFPLLIPGTSVVVQQDFVFHNPIAATSHLLMWRLRDYFDWFYQIPGAGSVAFVNKKRIEADAFRDLTPESFTLEEIGEAYEYSLSCVPEKERRPDIEAAKLLFLIKRGFYEAALRHAQWLIKNEIRFRQHVVADARRIIDQQNARVVRQGALPDECRPADKLEALTEIAALLPSFDRFRSGGNGVRHG